MGKWSDDPVVKAVREHGLRNFVRASNYAMAMAWSYDEHGRWLDRVEYAQEWNLRQRTADREIASFKAVSGYQTIGEMAEATGLLSKLDGNRDDARSEAAMFWFAQAL